MINTVPEARGNRGGTGLLPPNNLWWECEHNALDLRRELALVLGDRLEVRDAFSLIPGSKVIPHGELGAAKIYLDRFRGSASGHWSGMSIPLDDGTDLVVYNDVHPETRTRATLMEEFFHLRLGHDRSRIRILNGGDGHRTHHSESERIAYGSGAAALVPFGALRDLVRAAVPTVEIAHRFEVSRELVLYRMKITRQYNRRRAK